MVLSVCVCVMMKSVRNVDISRWTLTRCMCMEVGTVQAVTYSRTVPAQICLLEGQIWKGLITGPRSCRITWDHRKHWSCKGKPPRSYAQFPQVPSTVKSTVSQKKTKTKKNFSHSFLLFNKRTLYVSFPPNFLNLHKISNRRLSLSFLLGKHMLFSWF